MGHVPCCRSSGKHVKVCDASARGTWLPITPFLLPRVGCAGREPRFNPAVPYCDESPVSELMAVAKWQLQP